MHMDEWILISKLSQRELEEIDSHYLEQMQFEYDIEEQLDGEANNS